MGLTLSPVLITPPLSRQARENYPVYGDYLTIVSEVADTLHVPLVNAAEDMARREAAGDAVLNDWVHPSARGHEVIADLLTPAVAAALRVSP